MPHPNAPLTPAGRLRLARCVVEDGWPLRRAAERFQVAPTTAARWASRYRQHGGAGMVDRPSRPRHCPRRTPARTERRIVKLRVRRRWGAARIAHQLGLNPATVHRVLVRYRLPRLTDLDRASGQPIRRQPIRRYERAHPGELVHVDIKKLGNIPDGGGHWALGRKAGQRARTQTPGKRLDRNGKSHVGYGYLHSAVDDHSRLAYTEILPDETSQSAVAFWRRAHRWFAQQGLTVQRVLTDNGAAYKSRRWRMTLVSAAIRPKRTRPYRPQTNGKVERFHRTLADEWAYARAYQSETERRQALPGWLHTYNHHRPHHALHGLPPASRVPNLSGQYT